MSDGEKGGDRLLEFHRTHFKFEPEKYISTAQSYDPYGHIDGWYAYFFACHQQQFPEYYKDHFGVEPPSTIDSKSQQFDASSLDSEAPSDSTRDAKSNEGVESREDVEEDADEAVERYPDGTVRTLTDEDIAYFRAAELRQLDLEKEREELRKKQPKPVRPESVEESQPAWYSLPDRSHYEQLFGEHERQVRRLENRVNARFKKKAKGVAGYYPVLPINN
ncbi:hypothetical protein TRVA0_031S01002 [Trichomonascus vanleenenianus]|uniref:uncharacterized protein n=1 Tax=Trichomonascus vanleenenianus TaxID=2268995 RepID=UPI003EC97354